MAESTDSKYIPGNASWSICRIPLFHIFNMENKSKSNKSEPRVINAEILDAAASSSAVSQLQQITESISKMEPTNNLEEVGKLHSEIKQALKAASDLQQVLGRKRVQFGNAMGNLRKLSGKSEYTQLLSEFSKEEVISILKERKSQG